MVQATHIPSLSISLAGNRWDVWPWEEEKEEEEEEEERGRVPLLTLALAPKLTNRLFGLGQISKIHFTKKEKREREPVSWRYWLCFSEREQLVDFECSNPQGAGFFGKQNHKRLLPAQSVRSHAQSPHLCVCVCVCLCLLRAGPTAGPRSYKWALGKKERKKDLPNKKTIRRRRRRIRKNGETIANNYKNGSSSTPLPTWIIQSDRETFAASFVSLQKREITKKNVRRSSKHTETNEDVRALAVITRRCSSCNSITHHDYSCSLWTAKSAQAGGTLKQKRST